MLFGSLLETNNFLNILGVLVNFEYRHHLHSTVKRGRYEKENRNFIFVIGADSIQLRRIGSKPGRLLAFGF